MLDFATYSPSIVYPQTSSDVSCVKIQIFMPEFPQIIVVLYVQNEQECIIALPAPAPFGTDDAKKLSVRV